MLLACTGVVLAQATPSSQPDSAKNASKDKKIEGSYIVVLKENVDPDKKAKEKEQEVGLKTKHVYKHALKGFSAELSEDKVQKLRNDPDVAYVEQDQVMEAFDQQLPWGIKKIGADLSSTKAGDGSGTVSGVKAYIIDTGIDTTHISADGTFYHQPTTDLNVENAAAYNALGDGKDWDCAGHGTHVAGTVAATDNTQEVVGVGPSVPLIGVKVLNCSGSGATSGVIAGVDWVTKNAQNAQKPAIANMSLGGGASSALDTAVKNSAAAGIFYSIAAGNYGADACNYSPARAGKGTNGIMTTGAIDSSDKAASFSNYGSCVDVWAPGVNILSTKMGGGTSTLSGTSMAAPHVGGTAALYLAKYPTSTDMVKVEEQLKAASVSTGTKSNGSSIRRINALNY
jgi:subtilisin family serine protease